MDFKALAFGVVPAAAAAAAYMAWTGAGTASASAAALIAGCMDAGACYMFFERFARKTDD